ncbi:ABC transporter related [Beutenbergia cavernae DSM 12333]|uniref:ABC transporter related n=1 Tax=Beutenbergia cavernae (strain ATCC BAA-8 / DSM 12333 / CCUG 43141 / JCM 11478 / NBRC 16432 / NCIMB 13614 / HKI 0122) TaxID=471853 RepID=C5BXR6_BEUC1|nr:ATP-binding cassette domain-containing protein [Beutenbergia cavernae]ACQ78810.1 ABC transporter related [Beutenbergia cavernae DSM 12333]
MPQPVISTRALRKEYRYHRQQPGLLAAVRGLVHRTRETRVAVESLDLTIHEGEFVGLLGRNGAGKTTTLKMLSGLLRPTSGTVSVLGHEPARRRYDFLRRIAVVLGQKSMLWWDVSTSDSLRLHQAMYDLPRTRLDATVDELADLLQLRDLLDIPVRKLSLGERMKCELLVALVHEPDVLFLDEPTIGLDVVSKAAVREFLAALNATRGTTIILTSHDMDDVAELCRRVILVDHGRLQYDGDLPDLVRTIRPHKRVMLTFAASAHVPALLPPGVRLVDADDSPTGSRLDLEVEREAAQRLLAAAPGWGEVVDIEVRDADIDDVMRAVLAGEGA